MDYKKEIALILSNAVGVSEDEIYEHVKVSGDKSFGDYAFSCHKMAQIQKKSPVLIAKDIVSSISLSSSVDTIERIEAVGPYINFFVQKTRFIRQYVSEILESGEKYGSGEEGKNKTIVIDYSSPNITHEFHVGHLFSTVIGAALVRMYKFLGYNTIGINYIGDWGTQFGKLLYGYKNWSSEEALNKGGLDELTRVYVKFHNEAEKDVTLKNDAREWLLKLEAGDDEALTLWRRFCRICLDSMDKIYKRLGITFDSYRGESYYNDKMNAVVDELKEKDLLVESEGAMIVDLEEYKMPACLILRSDGGTLYPSRDIAAAIDRYKTYMFYKSVYVTDVRQSLHFQQFFKVLSLMGYEWAKDCIHIPYGLLSLETGPLKSRTGNVILLEDLFNESAVRALAIINEKNSNLSNKEQVAEDVGVGAVIFGVLYTSRIKDLVFSMDKALNFDGETGPYIQYTHARTCSVLSKCQCDTIIYKNFDANVLTDTAAWDLICALSRFPAKIREAVEKFEPFILSRALIDISQTFNKFYHENPILTSEDNVKFSRLALVKCVQYVLRSGLSLLGIKAPEQM